MQGIGKSSDGERWRGLQLPFQMIHTRATFATPPLVGYGRAYRYFLAVLNSAILVQWIIVCTICCFRKGIDCTYFDFLNSAIFAFLTYRWRRLYVP